MGLKIGKAKYGFTTKKYFKLKDGKSTFRILPPLGELADDGKWSMFYKVHYGYKNSKGKMRVFQSSEVVNRKTKMVEAPDAALDRIKQLKAKLEEAKATKNEGAIAALNKFVGPKGMYNLDNNHYLNVIDGQGNIGILKLRHRAKLALDTKIKELREKGIDPLSVDNGRYFTFTRSGTGLDTSFQVEITSQTINVQGVGEVQKEIVHQLSEELIGRLSQEAAELNKLFRAPTSEEVARIVAESDLATGQSRAVDEILDAKEDTSPDTDEGDDSGEDETPTTQVTAQTQVTPAATVQTQIITETKPTVALATPPVVLAPAAPAATVVSSPVTTTAQQVSEMSDADFLKSLGL